MVPLEKGARIGLAARHVAHVAGVADQDLLELAVLDERVPFLGLALVTFWFYGIFCLLIAVRLLGNLLANRGAFLDLVLSQLAHLQDSAARFPGRPRSVADWV